MYVLLISLCVVIISVCTSFTAQHEKKRTHTNTFDGISVFVHAVACMNDTTICEIFVRLSHEIVKKIHIDFTPFRRLFRLRYFAQACYFLRPFECRNVHFDVFGILFSLNFDGNWPDFGRARPYFSIRRNSSHFDLLEIRKQSIWV